MKKEETTSMVFPVKQYIKYIMFISNRRPNAYYRRAVPGPTL